jgi:transposase-like protein
MPKTPPYSPEFRAEAVRLLRSSGRSPEERASPFACLRRWLRKRSTIASVSVVRRQPRSAISSVSAAVQRSNSAGTVPAPALSYPADSPGGAGRASTVQALIKRRRR